MRDLCSPLACLDAGMSALDALNDEATFDIDRILLVKEQGDVVGWITRESDIFFSEDSKDDVVKDGMWTISPNEMMSADMNALSASRLIAETSTYFFFVIDGVEIIGTFGYRDLFKPAFRVCLFSLAIELEERTLQLLSMSPEDSWKCLNENRQGQAKEVFRKRYPNRGPEDGWPINKLLGCTMFCDKATMLVGRGLITKLPKKQIKQIFVRTEKVRNACAHADHEQRWDEILERQAFCSFIDDCHMLLEAISEAFRTNYWGWDPEEDII